MAGDKKGSVVIIKKTNPAKRHAKTAEREKKRHIIRWSQGDDELLILAMDKVVRERVKGFPWQAVSDAMSNIASAGAIEQHICKMRRRRIALSVTVPPVTSRVKETDATQASSAPHREVRMPDLTFRATEKKPAAVEDRREPRLLRPKPAGRSYAETINSPEDAEQNSDVAEWTSAEEKTAKKHVRVVAIKKRMSDDNIIAAANATLTEAMEKARANAEKQLQPALSALQVTSEGDVVRDGNVALQVKKSLNVILRVSPEMFRLYPNGRHNGPVSDAEMERITAANYNAAGEAMWAERFDDDDSEVDDPLLQSQLATMALQNSLAMTTTMAMAQSDYPSYVPHGLVGTVYQNDIFNPSVSSINHHIDAPQSYGSFMTQDYDAKHIPEPDAFPLSMEVSALAVSQSMPADSGMSGLVEYDPAALDSSYYTPLNYPFYFPKVEDPQGHADEGVITNYSSTYMAERYYAGADPGTSTAISPTSDGSREYGSTSSSFTDYNDPNSSQDSDVINYTDAVLMPVETDLYTEWMDFDHVLIDHNLDIEQSIRQDMDVDFD